MAAPYRLPSERTEADWAAHWGRPARIAASLTYDEATGHFASPLAAGPFRGPEAAAEKRRRRDAARAYRAASLPALLYGRDLAPAPAGVVPDYRGWAADLLARIDRAQALDRRRVAASRHPSRAHWLAMIDATGHQRIRLRQIALGLRQP